MMVRGRVTGPDATGAQTARTERENAVNEKGFRELCGLNPESLWELELDADLKVKAACRALGSIRLARAVQMVRKLNDQVTKVLFEYPGEPGAGCSVMQIEDRQGVRYDIEQEYDESDWEAVTGYLTGAYENGTAFFDDPQTGWCVLSIPPLTQ